MIRNCDSSIFPIKMWALATLQIHPANSIAASARISYECSYAKRILIVRLSAIGDCILSVPVLNALRRNFPNAKIAWVIERAASQLIQGHEALDEMFVVSKKTFKSPRQLMAFGKTLRDWKPDITLDLQGLTKFENLFENLGPPSFRGVRESGATQLLVRESGATQLLNPASINVVESGATQLLNPASINVATPLQNESAGRSGLAFPKDAVLV